MRGDLSAYKQNVQKNSIILGSNIQEWHQLICLGNSMSHQKYKKKKLTKILILQEQAVQCKLFCWDGMPTSYCNLCILAYNLHVLTYQQRDENGRQKVKRATQVHANYCNR